MTGVSEAEPEPTSASWIHDGVATAFPDCATPHCTVCGSDGLTLFTRRSDRMAVLRCPVCDMGVIETIPDDLMALYGDGYFYAEYADDAGAAGQGYADTAEHGVSWASALVRVIRPQGGRVLDVGCADGRLLTRLGPRYATFGVEPNAAMAQSAEDQGVEILARDFLDPSLTDQYAGSFDVITAIAVLEHLPDIRAAMAQALHLLRPDGVLLFEVPLLSTTDDNAVWFSSSPEHIWYPSERALRWLIEDVLQARLMGTELRITGYGCTYVGLVSRDPAVAAVLTGITNRILLQRTPPLNDDEAVARMQLHLVHAATTTHADLDALSMLAPAALTQPLLRRLSTLWQADLWRLGLARAESRSVQTALEQTNAAAGRLRADHDAAVSDRVRNATELTTEIVAAQARLAYVRKELDRKIQAERALLDGRTALDQDRAALEAAEGHWATHRATVDAELAQQRTELAQERQAIAILQASAIWRVAAMLRERLRSFPGLARLVRFIGRPVWRVVRSHLTRPGPAIPTPPPAAAPPPVVASPEPPPAPTPATPQTQQPLTGETLALVATTGHRPPLEPVHGATDWPLVSVVVTSFNYGHFVGNAVDSVLVQTFGDLEVIVVEGGSSDPDARMTVADLQRPRTRVLMQGGPHWVGANRNYGISQARGRYICCLDADDMLAPTYIEKAVYLLERHSYDVVSSAMEMIGHSDGVINILEQPDLAALLQGNHVLTCAVFRRTLWEQAGGFRDTDRHVTGYVFEDWAFWLRLAALGARFRNLSHDPLMQYRVHGPSLSRTTGVLPLWQQRKLVRQMNDDVLDRLAERLALSGNRAAIRYGTPGAPPAPIHLNPAAPVAPHRPTVLIALPYLILGGAERLLSSITAHLISSGWRVVIVTSIQPSAAHGDTTAWFELHTAEIFHLPRGLPPEMWEDFTQHLLRSRQVDVLWVVGSTFAYGSLRTLRAANPGLRVADLLFNTVGHTANNRRRRGLIDLIFVESGVVRDWLLVRGEMAARISLIESGVDLSRLRPAPRSQELMQRIGTVSGDLIIGFAGRWSEEKDPLGFVAIASLVDPALPVRFVMIGTGPMQNAIEEAVAAAVFRAGRFHVLGELPEIAPVLASLDLLVVPSVLDGRPMVVMEALALGVPVLASRVGGLPELIQDGTTGWLCEPGDHAGFAACIDRAGADRPRLAAMRDQARAFAEVKLDIGAMLNAYRLGLEALLPTSDRNA